MSSLLLLTGLITSFICSYFTIPITNWLLNVLPVGQEYFPKSPIPAQTYGELFATILIMAIFGYAIGLVHGILFGDRIHPWITLSAGAPLFLWILALAAATLGTGLILVPLLFAYGMIIGHGVRQGNRFRKDCKHGRKLC